MRLNVEELISYLSSYLEEREYLSTFEKVYREISKGSEEAYEGLKIFPFLNTTKTKVYGLPDVLNSLVNALYTGAQTFKGGKVPLLVFVGPSGSGKTILGKILEEALEEACEKDPPRKIVFLKRKRKKEIEEHEANGEYEINDICKYNEDPLGILTTPKLNIPRKIKKYFREIYDGDLCDQCLEKLNKILLETQLKSIDFYKQQANMELTEDEGNLKNSLLKYMQPLEKKAIAASVGTRFGGIDLSNEKLMENLENIIAKTNRGILHVHADNVENFKDQNMQFLLRISDKRINFNDGSSIVIDLIPIVYANENLLDKIEKNPVLARRIIKVHLRRNLSYTLEEKIISKFKIPFEHITPDGLKFYSMFIVGTRLKDDIYPSYSSSTDTEKKIGTMLELYDKFENLKPLREEDIKVIKERLMKTPPDDGWTKGITSDKAYEHLLSYMLKIKKRCLTLEDLITLMDNIISVEKSQLASGISHLKNYCEKKINERAFKDVVISFICVLEKMEPKDIEKEYNYLLELYKEKYINLKEKIKKVATEISIDEEMKKVCQRLCISDANALIEIIKKYFLDNGDYPSFYYILDTYPNLVAGSENMKTYIPWANLDKGLDKESKEKVNKIIEKMKLLGYDEDCALSAIRIASKKLS